MPSAERVKHFIRKILGCTCPEEVFRSIDARRAVRINSFIVLDGVLVIGDRLLVYVVEAGTEGCIDEHLPVLMNAGRKERDEKGLNRFRLVLVANRPEEMRQAVEKQFEELRDGDDKVHLHVICRNEMPYATEGTEVTEEYQKEGKL